LSISLDKLLLPLVRGASLIRELLAKSLLSLRTFDSAKALSLWLLSVLPSSSVLFPGENDGPSNLG